MAASLPAPDEPVPDRMAPGGTARGSSSASGDAAERAGVKAAHSPAHHVGGGAPLGAGRASRTPDVHGQWQDLLQIPQRPHPYLNLRRLFALAKRTTDFFGHRRGWLHEWLVRINPYPHPFRRVTIDSFDGTTIRGWLGLQQGRRPGVVLVPGMFSSKDDTVQKRKAIRMWRRWNYNVLIIELRGFGESGDRPNTPGWKEAEDVLAAARFLHAFNNVTTIGVLGESLGGTAALLAAAQEGLWEHQLHGEPEEAEAAPFSGQPGVGTDQGAAAGADEGLAALGARARGWSLVDATPLVEGTRDRRHAHRVIDAVLSVSPFSDPAAAVDHISRRPPPKDPFRRVQGLFRRLLLMHTGGRHADFRSYMEESATTYGVALETLYARSRVLEAIGWISCPALVLHAEDDPTTPVRHAHALHEEAAKNANVVTWILPWGNHVEFEILDRLWYWRVVGRYFGRWLGR